MRSLLDVNVLLTLTDEEHVNYGRLRAWWQSNAAGGWASCPLTQNGFVRISSQRGYPRHRPISEVLKYLDLQLADKHHEFWPDDISIADQSLFDHARILGPNQITDVYLLALAVKNGGRLVTFDAGVPLAAVKGAAADNLVRL